MKSDRRKRQISNLLKEEIQKLLLSSIADPRLQGIQISNVEVSGDLRVAWVYYLMPEHLKEAEIQKGFSKASGFIRKKIGEVAEFRYVPELHFKRDHALESTHRVLGILGGGL